MSDLNQMLATYRKLKKDCEYWEKEIKARILELGETVEGDGVIAKYNHGRKSYAYEKVALEHVSEDIICRHTRPKTDWRAACKEAGLVNIPFVEAEPTVSLKIVDKTEEIW